MTIQLKPEQEQVIGEAIRAGLLKNADAIIDVGLAAIRQRLEARSGPAPEMSTEEWVRELDAWIDSHSTTTPLLSDEAIGRDSIYGNRGM
jgi:hypothetical protein